MEEVIEKVIAFGFDNMHLEMITAFPNYANKNPIKLLQRNNFIIDEKMELVMVHDLKDHLIYSLAKADKK